MKQAEKLNLILRTLHSCGSSTIEEICEIQKIPINTYEEIKHLSERLRDEGYIKVTFTKGSTFATITSYGIEYCEEDSKPSKNNSLINNTFNIHNINNSPNSNIVLNSSKVNIKIQNCLEIEQKIKDIEQAILDSNEISVTEREDLKACLQDIKTSLDLQQEFKSPFFKLISLAANISTIASLVFQLGPLIFPSK